MGNNHQLLTNAIMSGINKRQEIGKTKIHMVATWLGFQAAILSQRIRLQQFRY